MLNGIFCVFLLQNSKDWKYQDAVDKAINNIVTNIKDIDNPYAQAVATYALQLAEHSSKDEALNTLLDKSIVKGNFIGSIRNSTEFNLIGFFVSLQSNSSGGANQNQMNVHRNRSTLKSHRTDCFRSFKPSDSPTLCHTSNGC